MSQESARQIFWQDAFPYVQQDCFAFYDGIWSTKQNDRIVDLAGGLGDAILSSSVKPSSSSISFVDKAVCFDTTNLNAGFEHAFGTGDLTFEIVAQVDKTYGNEVCFGIMTDNPWLGINIDQATYVRYTMRSGYDVDFNNVDLIAKPTYYAASRSKDGVVRFWRNGSLLREDSSIATYNYPLKQVLIGIWHSGEASKPLGSIIGKMFRASIYKRVLDATEIKKNYAADVERFNIQKEG